MKKTQYTLLLALCTIFYILTGCKKEPAAVPVSERIKNSFVAQSVTENGASVYTSGGTSNINGNYSRFKINLSNSPTVTITFVDGTTSTGTYALTNNDTQLVLSNLNPVPTIGATITFAISNVADGTVTLSGTTPDPKAGNKNVVYNLKKG